MVLMTPLLASAKIWDKDAKLSDIGEINIIILDGASDGCWTNISEARSYMIGKLEIAGAKISDDRSNQWQWLSNGKASLELSVAAKRTDAGVCIGGVDIQVGGVIEERSTGYVSIALFSSSGGTVSNSKNLNVEVLDYIGEALNEWQQLR